MSLHRRSIIICSHLVNDVEKVANRILVMKEGCLVMDAMLDDLKEEYFKVKLESCGASIDACPPSRGILELRKGKEQLLLVVKSEGLQGIREYASAAKARLDEKLSRSRRFTRLP
jgi:ABC-type multidrug transport system ATPase subunit